MYKNKFIYLLVLLPLLVFSGCNEEPNNIGANLLPPSDEINLSTWNTLNNPIDENSFFFRDTISLSYSNTVLLGSYNQAKSYLLVKFLISLPDSIKNALAADSLTFVEAWLSSAIKYKLGDGSNLDFTAHKINSNWNAGTFTLDSLASLEYNPQDVYLSQELTDSTFKFHIQPDAPKEWLYNQVNSDSAHNYGIYLQPNAGGNLILGFPALSSALSTSRIKLTCVTRILGSAKLDTLGFYTSADVHVVERPIPANITHRMLLQAGTGVRSGLFFDFSSFPKSTIINKATLKIFYDITEAEFGTNKSDTLVLNVFADSSARTLNTALGTEYLFGDSTTFSGELTSFVQKWVDSSAVNQGMQIKLSDEETTANQLLLYGADYSDSTKRPQLEILYTKMR